MLPMRPRLIGSLEDPDIRPLTHGDRVASRVADLLSNCRSEHFVKQGYPYNEGGGQGFEASLTCVGAGSCCGC